MRSSVDTHNLSKKAGSLSYKVLTYILRINSSGDADNGLNAFLPHCCKQHILRRYTVPVERRHTFGSRFKSLIHNWKAHTAFTGNLFVMLITPKTEQHVVKCLFMLTVCMFYLFFYEWFIWTQQGGVNCIKIGSVSFYPLLWIFNHKCNKKNFLLVDKCLFKKLWLWHVAFQPVTPPHG